MKTLTLETYNELLPYIKEADYNEYNSNIITMLMWSSMYEVKFEVFDHFALALSIMPNRSPIWLMPYCAPIYRKAAIDKIKQLSCESSLDFEIHSMTIEFKNWLQESYPDQFLVWDCYDARDYIYDRKQQETLVGKKMQKRRNHFNSFQKEYNNRYVYKAIEDEDIPHIYTFLQEWKSSKDQDKGIDAEEEGIHLLLSNLHTLPIRGGCIYIDGTLEAFNITSLLSSDTVQIHVEKANRSIRGLYIAILKFFLESLEDDIMYLNREDDLGLEDLRKAKKDMHPISKTKKFACCEQQIEIKKANDDNLEDIMNLWKQRFDEESDDTSDYFFTHLYQPSSCYILISDGELISMIHARNMNIMLNNVPERVSFLVGIATTNDYEGCGYMKRLLQHILQDLKKEERFVLLQAYNPAIYKPFGFEETYPLARTKLDKTCYNLSNGVVSSQFLTSELLDIYQMYTQAKNGYRIRDESYYKQTLPYKAIWDEQTLIHRTNNIADSYCIVHEDEHEIHIQECIYKNEEALHSLLSALCESDKTIFATTDIDTPLSGRRKVNSAMMVKSLQKETFPTQSLFINEEL